MPTTLPQVYSHDDVLAPYVYVFGAAFLVSLLLTPLMRTAAAKLGIMDHPGERKIHRRPVAYLGGLAIFIGVLAGLASSRLVHVHWTPEMDCRSTIPVPLGLIAGGMLMLLLGLYDDIRPASPGLKLVLQLFAALCLLWDDVGRQSSWFLIEPVSSRLHHWFGMAPLSAGHWLVISSSYVLVILTIIGACNATNLLDGLDGLCGGVMSIVVAGFLLLAAAMAADTRNIDPPGDALRIVLCLALLGGILGFLPYNFNPASIFMGDAGSLSIGYLVGALMVLFTDDSKMFFAALVVFALPILDTLLAIARRIVNHRPMFSPDRMHFHHQLVRRGLSVKQAVLLSYLLAVAFVALGSAITVVRTRYVWMVWLVVFSFILVSAWKMGMVDEGRSPRDPEPSPG